MIDRDDESVDFAAIKDLLRLILRAPLRHSKLSAAVFVGVTALGLTAARHTVPSYQAEASVLVQKNVVLPNFGETQRNVPSSDFDPSIGVSESVKGRDNLIALVRQTHLAERTNDPPGQKPRTAEERIPGLVKLLELRLGVKSDASTIQFTAMWDDPETAYDLVSSAVQSFLQGRSAAEVSVIADAITLLEDHAQNVRDGIDDAMAEFIRQKETWKPPPTLAQLPPAAAGVYRPHPLEETSAGTTGTLAKRLEEKKLQIKETEDDRRRQLSELKAQLAGLLGTYTPSYPPVMALQRKIDALSEEPANLASLKNEERSLLSEIASVTGAGDRSGGGARLPIPGIGPSPAGRAPSPNSRADLEIDDPASAMALSKLQNRIHKYEEYMDQISAAKLELDLARNAFKYRYVIYKPAELPTVPRRPVRQILAIGGTLLALFAAVAAAGLLDLLSGRFIEAWQVKRKLNLPVLGEVSRRS